LQTFPSIGVSLFISMEKDRFICHLWNIWRKQPDDSVTAFPKYWPAVNGQFWRGESLEAHEGSNADEPEKIYNVPGPGVKLRRVGVTNQVDSVDDLHPGQQKKAPMPDVFA
ncbi:hypothetical protein, partial [Pseudomonas syringae group genomosp. 3]|uniref:hypothetical protein n=1 Tax=Pseudomonas syringae group genomosp. 3 TaxID=251701 RepID=UPI001C81D678